MIEEDLLREAASPALERIREDRRRAGEFLVPVLAYLEDHLFSTQLDVNQLKRACGIRDGAFAMHFHRALGSPPKTYITECRMETAQRLLEHTDLKIWRIAVLEGYSGLQVFSKAFLRWSGVLPSCYRSIRQSGKDQPATDASFLAPSGGP